MANQNPDTTAEKVESSTENGNVNQQHNAGGHGGPGGQGGGLQGGRRGGRFGGSGGGGGRRHNPNIKQENFERKRPRGNMSGGPGGPREMGPGGGPGRNPDDRLNEKLAQLSGHTIDLPPLDTTEKKFSGRSRLYIGNISPDVTEEELNELFKKYGETSELFLNKEKNFGFVRMDYHANAEKAKRELEGTTIKGRNLKIRFAPNGSSIKVKNLTPWVTNELLHAAFGIFGEIERAVIIVDDRGKSTGEGIVEFARKNAATQAVRKCNESCYFITASLRPVIVELYEALDEWDGYPEKNVNKKNPEYTKDREVGPRFATHDSFEHDYGTRWKQLHELYAQKEQALKKELEMEKEKLEAQMEYARYEHETEILREKLRVREMDRERQKREWEMKERQAEEQRQRTEEQMRRQQEEMQARMMHQEEELRRRQQENSLFMQAHQLDNMLDQQEQAYQQPDDRGLYGTSIPPDMGGNNPLDNKPFMNTNDRYHRFDERNMNQMGRSGGNMGGRGHWVNENRAGGPSGRDDYPNKRRRY
ncbi:hrp65 protein [Agrilus planipennis]|uniref:Hrp65 protein n=1 Tax=Agrilus planipennis TaxID=224129 RepID=A0A7F5RHW9_AGRPL|nr:hrp65 protein [Agrilus planipennis]